MMYLTVNEEHMSQAYNHKSTTAGGWHAEHEGFSDFLHVWTDSSVSSRRGRINEKRKLAIVTARYTREVFVWCSSFEWEMKQQSSHRSVPIVSQGRLGMLSASCVTL